MVLARCYLRIRAYYGRLQDMHNDLESLLTPQEVADKLKISLHTLASWRRQTNPHDLPWIEVGGSIRYRRSDVETWLNKRTLGGVLPV